MIGCYFRSVTDFPVPLSITPTFPVDGFAFPSNNIYLVQASFNSGHFINFGRVKGLSAVFIPVFDHLYLQKAVLNSQRIAAIERQPLFVFFHKPANSIGFKPLQSIQVVLKTRRTWEFSKIRWRWRPSRLVWQILSLRRGRFSSAIFTHIYIQIVTVQIN